MSKKITMELKSVEEARAFIFFMMNEKNRHKEDIDQIEETVRKVCRAFNIEAPELDPSVAYWTVVKDSPPEVRTEPTYPTTDEGEID